MLLTPIPQPAKAHLAMRRVTNRRLARLYGSSDTYVSRVLNGYEPPSARFRSFLAELLGEPESALFRAEDPVPTGAGR